MSDSRTYGYSSAAEEGRQTSYRQGHPRGAGQSVHPHHSKPFTSATTADEILAKVRLVQTSIKQLVDNNAK